MLHVRRRLPRWKVVEPRRLALLSAVDVAALKAARKESWQRYLEHMKEVRVPDAVEVELKKSDLCWRLKALVDKLPPQQVFRAAASWQEHGFNYIWGKTCEQGFRIIQGRPGANSLTLNKKYSSKVFQLRTFTGQTCPSPCSPWWRRASEWLAANPKPRESSASQQLRASDSLGDWPCKTNTFASFADTKFSIVLLHKSCQSLSCMNCAFQKIPRNKLSRVDVNSELPPTLHMALGLEVLFVVSGN